MSRINFRELDLPLGDTTGRLTRWEFEQPLIALIRRLVAKRSVPKRRSQAANGREMMNAIEFGRFDLVVLDLMMPGESGLVLCQKLREQNGPPVIMLTAMGSEVDRVIGLEIGADD